MSKVKLVQLEVTPTSPQGDVSFNHGKIRKVQKVELVWWLATGATNNPNNATHMYSNPVVYMEIVPKNNSRSGATDSYRTTAPVNGKLNSNTVMLPITSSPQFRTDSDNQLTGIIQGTPSIPVVVLYDYARDAEWGDVSIRLYENGTGNTLMTYTKLYVSFMVYHDDTSN